MKRFLIILVALIPLFAAAELVQPVTWSGEAVGDSVRIKAAIEPGWHMNIIEHRLNAIGAHIKREE